MRSPCPGKDFPALQAKEKASFDERPFLSFLTMFFDFTCISSGFAIATQTAVSNAILAERPVSPGQQLFTHLFFGTVPLAAFDHVPRTL